MKEYLVTTSIVLEVEACNENEAKEVALEQLSDFHRHHSFDELMEVEEIGKVKEIDGET